MRKIIYAWNYREWGGAQIYFMSLMKEAKKAYEVSALIPADSEPKILQYLNSIDIPVQFLLSSLSLKKADSLFDRFTNRTDILRSENQIVKSILGRPNLNETIIHIDLGFWQSFLSLATLCRKTTVFSTVHTGLPCYTGWRKWRWKMKGEILSRFTSFHLLASNQDAKESLKPYISVDKFRQVEVTYSGIDPAEITQVAENLPVKASIVRRYRLPENKPILMTVGQFIERKGCWILLESMKRLKESGIEFVFLWLSTTLPNAEILQRIETYGLGDSFRLMDADEIGDKRSDLLTLESVADLFVLASLQEGLPIALIEAMALGLPCIATDVNAIPEAIDGQNGILVQPNDPVRLTEAILSLLNDPAKRETLANRAKKTAFEKFNSKITAERTVKLYDEVWQTHR